MRTTEEQIASINEIMTNNDGAFEMSVKEYSKIIRRVLVMASLLFDNGVITADQYLQLISFD